MTSPQDIQRRALVIDGLSYYSDGYTGDLKAGGVDALNVTVCHFEADYREACDRIAGWLARAAAPESDWRLVERREDLDLARTAGRTGIIMGWQNMRPVEDDLDRLALFQQLFAARSADIDVFQVDVVWPGMLAEHLLDLSPHVDRATIAAHFPALIANNTVDGRLVALPWFTNAGLLYYRRDLLEKHGRAVPATWAELEETARIVMEAERAKGHDRIWGFVFQARAYEGLTVNALEWIDSHGGGRIVEAAIGDDDDRLRMLFRGGRDRSKRCRQIASRRRSLIRLVLLVRVLRRDGDGRAFAEAEHEEAGVLRILSEVRDRAKLDVASRRLSFLRKRHRA